MSPTPAAHSAVQRASATTSGGTKAPESYLTDELDVRRSAFGVRRSRFVVRRSGFDVHLDDDAGDHAGAEQHDDARPDARCRSTSGTGVRQQVETRNGDGYKDKQRSTSQLSTLRVQTSELSRRLTSFISSHTALRGRVPQQIRRVKCRNQLRAAVVEQLPAQARDRRLSAAASAQRTCPAPR